MALFRSYASCVLFMLIIIISIEVEARHQSCRRHSDTQICVENPCPDFDVVINDCGSMLIRDILNGYIQAWLHGK